MIGDAGMMALGMLLAGLVFWVVRTVERERKFSADAAAWERTKGPFAPRADEITVPVTQGFDMSRPAGFLVLKRDALPPTADFCFALGYRDNGCALAYDVLQVALVPDAEYLRFLQHRDGSLHGLADEMLATVGCGDTVGHGDSCAKGWECGHCQRVRAWAEKLRGL